MSKKFIITIISVILAFFLITLIGYYFIIQNNTDSNGNPVSGFKNFFPFGGNSPTTGTETPTANVPLEPQEPVLENFNQKIRKITNEPVAGAGTLDTKVGTIVRYIEKATGHIFEVELFSPNQNRISNTTIPVVYDAVWGNKNTSLITRYLKEDNQTVDTYSLILKTFSTSTESALSGIIFPEKISDVSVFGSSVFYMVEEDNSSIGFISNFDSTKKKQVWISPIKQLNSQFVNANTVSLTTKPAPNIPGYLYFVNTLSGQVSSILGGIPGLSTLTNYDGTEVLYLNQTNNTQMFVWNIKNKIAINLSPSTFPEKCVWSKKNKSVLFCAVPQENINGGSLTSWYKGLRFYRDDIWKYDTENNTASIFVNLTEESGEVIDVVKPLLSDNEQYLIFTNKIDNSLWSLDLTK